MANNIFKGIEITNVPKVGGGWSHSVGSDSYGGAIIYVSPDNNWFICDNGNIAKLETRKNSIHYGKYVNAIFKNPEFQQAHEDLMKRNYAIEYLAYLKATEKIKYKEIYKNLKVQPTCHCVGCTFNNVRWVHEKPQTTYLDPSF